MRRGVGKVGDGGEALGVDRREAESRPPNVKVEHCRDELSDGLRRRPRWQRREHGPEIVRLPRLLGQDAMAISPAQALRTRPRDVTGA